jgi:hypothetical protein
VTSGITVLVLQWAHAGRAAELGLVEDVLSQLAVDHGAELERYRGTGFGSYAEGAAPDEVHILRFPHKEAVDEYVADPDRAPWALQLGDVLARTMVIQLDAWG